MGSYNSYGDDEKARVLARVAETGDLDAISLAFDVPRSTLRAWCRAAGVVYKTDKTRTQAATAAAAAARHARVEESNSRMTLILATIIELAGRLEIDILRDANAKDKVPLGSIVNARTRAFHDLQLLEGAPTERTETVETVEEVASLRDTLRDRLSVVPDADAG